MAKVLIPTGDTLTLEYPVERLSAAFSLMTSISGVVLEAPGEQEDRFYVAVSVDGTINGDFRPGSGFVALKQMREAEDPERPLDWRKLYSVVRLDYPPVARVI